ncbi:hypothetical protein VTP01DRAFT_9305 [Rhizomucor pusillus]|uniref:uncharacterized protein n=1 Tax=Rhizomucor pusillus TaxID=4840 RepID=UPI0037442E67
MFYSYKLKKSGFRTEVCTDINGMVLFVSDAAPCLTNNDGSMLSEMNLKGKVNKYDCVAIDGGYALFVDLVLANNPHLGNKTLWFQFGNNEVQISQLRRQSVQRQVCGSVGDMNTFTVQFKLACVLRNIKKFVAFGGVPTSEITRIGCNLRLTTRVLPRVASMM